MLTRSVHIQDLKAAGLTVTKQNTTQWFWTLTYLSQKVGDSYLVLCLVIDVNHRAVYIQGLKVLGQIVTKRATIGNICTYIPLWPWEVGQIENPSDIMWDYVRYPYCINLVFLGRSVSDILHKDIFLTAPPSGHNWSQNGPKIGFWSEITEGYKTYEIWGLYVKEFLRYCT